MAGGEVDGDPARVRKEEEEEEEEQGAAGEMAMDTGTPSSIERYLAMATAAASSPPSTPPLTILAV
jgi:hypothetical protein